MSMLWIIIISIVITLVLAFIVALLIRKADNKVDDFQRKINKLENCFAEAGASWMSELLEDLVVGDETATVHKLRDFIEAPNVPLFFLEKVALPCAKYAIREATPEQLLKLKSEFAKNDEGSDAPTNPST